MDKFSDPYFDILMNSASHFEEPQKSLPNFIFNFEDNWKENLHFTRP